MGISSLSLQFARLSIPSLFIAPVQLLAALFVPGQASATFTHTTTKRPQVQGRVISENKFALRQTRTVTPAPRATKAPAPSRLKVLREFEPGMAPAYAGRMVISGRMADVCAELERMTQPVASARQTELQF